MPIEYTMTEPEKKDLEPKIAEDQHTESEIDAATKSSPEQESQDVSESELNSAAELEAAQQEIAKLKDAFLRAKAEEDNVRRRTEKEVANSRKFAVEGFAKEMLNVYDSLKLAVAVEVAEDADEAVKSIHEGVDITLKQLQSVFSKFSLTEISPEVGEKLDPNLHQAMSVISADDVASGCVVNVIQVGFQLHDRLLRPAMVIVAQ